MTADRGIMRRSRRFMFIMVCFLLTACVVAGVGITHTRRERKTEKAGEAKDET